MRSTLKDAMLSRIPESLKLCNADLPRIASFVNEAQHRLLMAGGETGWWGTWYRIALTVAADKTITVPRNVARIINLEVCNDSIPIRNEFYEFLEAGVGLQPANSCSCDLTGIQLYDRGVTPTYVSMSEPLYVRLYISDARDVGKRVLVQGLDTNGRVVRSTDGTVEVQGVYLTLAAPFVESAFPIKITGIQKDLTVADVLLYQVNADATVTRLALYEPSETNPSYRRYYLPNVPDQCCTPGDTSTLTGLAKLEFIPAQVESDWLIIGNLPALKHECLSVYYEEMDIVNAQQLSLLNHRKAINLLNKELDLYIGRERPSIGMAIDGTSRFENKSIGTMI